MTKHNVRDAEGKFATNGKANGKTRNRGPSEYQMREMAMNVLVSRRKIIDEFMDSRRSVDDDAGYPPTGDLTVDKYRQLYDREAIAARVVEILPKESWKVQPSVSETEDVDQDTEFEVAFDDMANSLRGDSWFKNSENNPLWEMLERIDVLSGIGSFGVLLLGLDDGQDMEQPAEGSGERKLLFLRAFGESLVQISTYERDPGNPRFGQPNSYEITFNDIKDTTTAMSSSTNTGSRKVHWTRVIHIADNLSSSEVFGIPRMRPVYNRLHDLRKLYGGSAEMYWRGAFPGLSFETHPELGGDVDFTREQKDAIRDQAEQYQNTLQRMLLTTGMTVKSLPTQVVDPTPQIDTQIEAICVELGVPKRIFTGSERGELASSQDILTWNTRMAGRQNGYVTPRIIVPLIDRCITLKILPEPGEDGYNVVWPDLGSATADETATIAVKKTEALAKYVQGNVEALIPPLDFLTKILGMGDDEAVEVLEAAIEEMDDKIAEGIIEDPAATVEMDTKFREADLKTAQQPKVQQFNK